ncbi:Transcription initiation factor TFIID subunit 7 [Termitomyces sp. J132]|nr:Transcription initiation factor TFIID subunit 7 [Termitomyces sp. J132]
MDEDLIVVDDVDVVETQAGPSTSTPTYAFNLRTKSVAESSLASTSRLRSGSHVSTNPSMKTPERTTRSAAYKNKPQPKLKLKLSDKAAALAPGMSFLGQYDRELDSDEEDLAFEEQFILRMSPGEDLEKLKKMVAAREVGNDVWFKFKGEQDSRRAVFHIGNSTYSAKLVDLPCIIESQKTLDNKQMFKVADICQMFVVDRKLENDEPIAHQTNFNIDEFIWPHGMTPPLHHVRKRRFRKRVNRRTIESVEQEVERLLAEDSLATEIKYDVLDNVNPDLSDSEFIEREEPIDAPTPAISDSGEPQTPVRDLEAAVAKKGREVASSANPLIKKRFEDALKKLTADLEMKLAQRDELKEKQRMKKEGLITMDADSDPEGGATDGRDDADMEENDLFGSDDRPVGMDLT